MRFSHYTAKELLHAHFLDNLCSPADIAETCLTYLALDDFEQGPVGDNKEARDQRAIKFQALSHVAEHWVRRIEVVEAVPEIRGADLNAVNNDGKMLADMLGL